MQFYKITWERHYLHYEADLNRLKIQKAYGYVALNTENIRSI